jgi:hypothetical protein
MVNFQLQPSLMMFNVYKLSLKINISLDVLVVHSSPDVHPMAAKISNYPPELRERSGPSVNDQVEVTVLCCGRFFG